MVGSPGRYSVFIVTGLLLLLPPVSGRIVDSLHNLSVSGPGTYKSLSEDEICIFCHITHSADSGTVLWNRPWQGESEYIPYNSTTMDARPGVPNGTSKLCLTCHDGTIARRTHGFGMPNLDGRFTGSPDLGTDLSDDHPISFAYSGSVAAGEVELAAPENIASPVSLDFNGFVQCTSCHDPHQNRFGHFLVMDNYQSRLCTACHRLEDWNQSPHRNSTAAWNGRSPDPWPESKYDSVAGNGCLNCHDNHGADTPQWLLKDENESDLCFRCHNGNVASHNILPDFNAFSTHPLAMSVQEEPRREWTGSFPLSVHCRDCHNPHGGDENGVDAFRVAGTVDPGKRLQHESCYGCHGDPAETLSPELPRQISQSNVRLEFSRDNPSFHPVETSGKNPDVPSLLDPWTTASQMTCTDCHASDRMTDDGNISTVPHGSRFPPILNRQYETGDNLMESPNIYALCYHCHSRDILLSDQSAFPEHYRHVSQVKTSCATCHDAHGISATQGNRINNSHLINFKIDVVHPSYRGKLEFRDQGRGQGNCTLECHGHNHERKPYGGLSSRDSLTGRHE